MTLKTFEVHEQSSVGPVYCKVALDAESFVGGKYPAILILPNGMVAQRYVDCYVLEEAYYATNRDILLEGE